MSKNTATVATDAKRADLIGYVNAWQTDGANALADVNDAHSAHLFTVGLHLREGTGVLPGKNQGERAKALGLNTMTASRLGGAWYVVTETAKRLGVKADPNLAGAMYTAISATNLKAVKAEADKVESLADLPAAVKGIKVAADAKRTENKKAARPNDANAKHGGTGDTSAVSNGDTGDVASLVTRVNALAEYLKRNAESLTVEEWEAVTALGNVLDGIQADYSAKVAA